MPMSDYLRSLRQKIENDVLEVPSVSILTFDANHRVLLVRHVEDNVWTNPGGMIEPYETPAAPPVYQLVRRYSYNDPTATSTGERA